MLVVVEGVDRTGKSTLCEMGAELVGGTCIHWDAPKPGATDPLREYIMPISGYEPRTDQILWIDRHYLGELVWPRIFGRESLFSSPEDLALVERTLQLKGAMCVLATRDADSLEIACQDEPCRGQAAFAQDLFRAVAYRSSLNWFPYQHEVNPWDLEQTIELVIKLARAADERAVGF